jgi:cytochrome c oxidase subunit 2
VRTGSANGSAEVDAIGSCRPQLSIVLAACVLGTACAGPASTLDPGGTGAARITGLTWLLIVVMAVVYAAVLAVLALVVRRTSRPRAPGRTGWAVVGVVAGGIVAPVVVISVLAIASVRALADLTRPSATSLVIEVVAHQYWWEFRYRDGEGEPMITANELHLPVGQRAELRLFAADVIHSFWVPALQGKLDLVPGKVNVTWVQAERAGTYHGQCAEYCGIQHALMRMVVVAQEPPAFDRWLAAQRRPAEVGRDEGGRHAERLFFVHCATCHRVRGTSAFFGVTAPDLTHVASRSTLAAGAFPNGKGHLARWIADPQALKPGNRMPRIPLAAADVHALVEYVHGLR